MCTCTAWVASCNILARNQDDHVKNFAFLMGRHGAWRLSPAFDVTWANGNAWTTTHQMTVNGKGDTFSRKDVLAAGHAFDLPRGGAQRAAFERKRVIDKHAGRDLRQHARRSQIRLVHGGNTSRPSRVRATHGLLLPVGNSRASSLATQGARTSRPSCRQRRTEHGVVRFVE